MSCVATLTLFIAKNVSNTSCFNRTLLSASSALNLLQKMLISSLTITSPSSRSASTLTKALNTMSIILDKRRKKKSLIISENLPCPRSYCTLQLRHSSRQLSYLWQGLSTATLIRQPSKRKSSTTVNKLSKRSADWNNSQH